MNSNVYIDTRYAVRRGAWWMLVRVRGTCVLRAIHRTEADAWEVWDLEIPLNDRDREYSSARLSVLDDVHAGDVTVAFEATLSCRFEIITGVNLRMRLTPRETIRVHVLMPVIETVRQEGRRKEFAKAMLSPRESPRALVEEHWTVKLNFLASYPHERRLSTHDSGVARETLGELTEADARLSWVCHALPSIDPDKLLVDLDGSAERERLRVQAEHDRQVEEAFRASLSESRRREIRL